MARRQAEDRRGNRREQRPAITDPVGTTAHLDGGHAALIVAEGAIARVRRRPRYRLDPNRFRVAAAAVVVVLLALGATSMYIDVLHPLSAVG